MKDKNLWGNSKDAEMFTVSEGPDMETSTQYIFQVNLVNRSVDIVRKAKKGTTICTATGNINLAIQWAAQYYNNTELIKYLISKGADITVNNKYVVRNAITLDNTDLIKFLNSDAVKIR